MLVGHFTEQPWQDLSTGLVGAFSQLQVSNEHYNPEVGRQLYNRYLDEKMYAEETGFEALMFNEHHSAPFCIQGVTNVEIMILARQTSKVKLIPLGNPLPIWDDPLWLAESIAMMDMISHGRMVSGFVRGGGPESISHNANTTYNRERFNEAHDFIIKTWTTPGPFRWEGKHHHFRYVNPWCLPLQKPHPPIWIPGVSSPETVKWCAEHHYPYVMLASRIEPTKEMFDLYHQHAAELGYKSGTQNVAYLFKVHVEETEEQAEEAGRKYLEGVANPFIAEGNEGFLQPHQFFPPGYSSRASILRMQKTFADLFERTQQGRLGFLDYETNVKHLAIITGTPKSVMPKVRHVLETLRPGTIFLWDGDGAMSHGDQMRSLKLHGQEVIPAAREIGKELGLKSPYETNDGTGIAPDVWAKAKAAGKV